VTEQLCYDHNEGREKSVQKLLRFPGIIEAIELVWEHAWIPAINDALDNGAEGNLGEEACQLFSEGTPEALDKFFEDQMVDNFIQDRINDWLEEFAYEISTKICELWDFSESAIIQIARLIYWGESHSGTKYADMPMFLLLVNQKDEEIPQALRTRSLEFLQNNTILVSASQLKEGHIYLDVTHLPHRYIRLAYKPILLARKYLRIVNKDLREGAPESIDTEKALQAVHLEKACKTAKEIARELGFEIYSRDNPSGSYPLLYKYLSRGRDIYQKLVNLEVFLKSLSG